MGVRGHMTMQDDKTVSVAHIAAVAAWIATVGFILTGTLVGLSTGHVIIAFSLMAHGLAMSAAAATVTIRCMMRTQNRLITNAFHVSNDVRKVRAVR